jgi:hypothetical protein
MPPKWLGTPTIYVAVGIAFVFILWCLSVTHVILSVLVEHDFSHCRLLLERGYTVSGSGPCANQSTREWRQPEQPYTWVIKQIISGADWVFDPPPFLKTTRGRTSPASRIPIQTLRVPWQTDGRRKPVWLLPVRMGKPHHRLIAWIWQMRIKSSYIIGSTAQNLETNAHAGTDLSSLSGR